MINRIGRKEERIMRIGMRLIATNTIADAVNTAKESKLRHKKVQTIYKTVIKTLVLGSSRCYKESAG